MKKRLFVDMDGTLAEFKTIDTLETLYEEGYFLNLKPFQNVVDAIQDLCLNHKEDVEVYIMSAYLSDSKYALKEKNQWLDIHLPFLDKDHRIFPPCGAEKGAYVPYGLSRSDYLLDDYTHNLVLWQPPGSGIKLMNDINGRKGTWKGEKIPYDMAGVKISNSILDTLEKPLVQEQKYFSIFHLKDDLKGKTFLRGKSLSKIREKGFEVENGNYYCGFSGGIAGCKSSDVDLLEKLYATSQQEPDRFDGKNLLCGDIVVVYKESGQAAYYCNDVGWKSVPEFLDKANQKESLIEIEDEEEEPERG